MKSIESKIMSLTGLAILIVAILGGGTGIRTLQVVSKYDSAKILNLTADTEAAKLDKLFLDVKRSVDIIAEYADARIFSVEKLVDDEAYRGSYTEQISNTFENVVTYVPGVLSYWIRYSPDIMGPLEGFCFKKNAEDGEFYEAKLVDLSKYTREDHDYSDWWYLPVDSGEATWLEPYSFEDYEGMLITYAVPLYCDGIMYGLAGIDIDYEELVEDVAAIQCYDSGYGSLINTDGKVFYNPNYDFGTNINDLGVSESFSFTQEKSGAVPLTYTIGNVEKQMAYRTLVNGMKFVITAPTKEIKAVTNNLTRQVVVSTILILITFIFVTLVVVGKVTRPLKDLAKVAREINGGNLEVVFPKKTNDEVGDLITALEKMVHHLKHHIDDLNSLAYHDALTGVKNKTAYDDATAKLDSIKGEKEYGLIVFDANNLKKINDTYGHERGNVYLQNACRLTCRIFKGSPVFRIGGDEFAVILQGDDYDNCYKLMRDFDMEAERINKEKVNEWEKINIAKGMVKYDPTTDENVESVFKRADARMYVAKQKMKLAEV